MSRPVVSFIFRLHKVSLTLVVYTRLVLMMMDGFLMITHTENLVMTVACFFFGLSQRSLLSLVSVRAFSL